MGELPKGWMMIPLGEITKNYDGQRIPVRASDRQNRPGQYPYYGASGIIDSVDDFLFDGDFLLVAEDGANLLARSTPIAFRARGKFWVNNHAHVVQATEASSNAYLERYLNSLDLAKYVTGSAQPKLTQKALNSIPVFLPPLPEQRRIVAKIDSLSAKSKRARDHLDHIPRLVEKYKQAILAAAFRGDLTREWRARHKTPSDYPIKSIGELAEVVTGSTPPTKEKERFFGGGIAFCKPTDLGAGYNVVQSREKLTEAGAAVARMIPAGATLVTCIGATIGKTGFARVDCCTNQQINSLVPNRSVVMPEWLYWMVVSPNFQQSILDNSSATTLPIINKGRFLKLSLPTPKLEEQGEIVRRMEIAFDWIERLADNATSARKLIDNLDQAILAKAFRGELVPQNPSDEPASALLERIKASTEGSPAENHSTGPKRSPRGRKGDQPRLF